jgi:threonine dehydrogenase-like Zn-dependent dehydrogenase
MGLMNLQLAKQCGAASVDVVDLNPDRLATAVQLGCSGAAGSADDLQPPPHGWDVVIDCTGVVAAIEDGLGRVGKGGTFLQFGVSAEQAQARWAPFRIYNQEITITGSMAVLHTFERAAEMFAAGVLDPKVFISDRYPLEQYAEALQQFRNGIGRKVQVNPRPQR